MRIFSTLLLTFALLFGAGCTQKAKVSRHVKRGDQYFAQERYERAHLEYLNAVRLDRTNKVAIRNLGAIYFADDQLMRALPFLNTAKQLEPENYESRGRLARVYFAAGALKEARAEAEEILKNDPTNEAAILVLVDASATPEQLASAEQSLQAIQQKTGAKAIFKVAEGYIAARRGNTKAAEDAFKQAVAADPKSAAAQWALGSFYWAEQKNEEAKAPLQAAAELSPIRSTRRLRWIEFNFKNNAVEAGRTALAEITKKAPDYLPAWVLAARVALSERKTDEASSAIDRILAAQPDHYEGLSLRADLRLAQNNIPSAITDLERLTTTYPKSAPARYQLALAHLLNRDAPKAAAALNQAINLQPGFNEAILLLAELNIRTGQAPLAIASLTDLVQKRPNVEKAHVLLGRALQATDRADDAIAVFQKMRTVFPKSVEASLLLGTAYRQGNKTNEARAVFEQVLTANPDQPGAVANLVELDMEANNYPKAIERINQQIKKYPKEALPVFILAKIYLAQNKLKEAQAELEKVIELDPEQTGAYLLLARVYSATRQVDAALARLEQLLQKKPKDAGALLMTGMLYSQKLEYTKARDAYEKLLVDSPNSVVALNNLANLYADHLDQIDKAYEFGRRAEELRPKDPAIIDTFGWILARRGDYGLAVTLLKESARQMGGDPEVQYHLGYTHYMRGEEVPARTALERSLSLSTNFTGRAEAADAIGILNIKPGNPAATPQLEARLAKKPSDPVALNRLVPTYVQSGAYDKAIGAYERALAANPKMPSEMAALAELYADRAGKPDKALELVKNARKLAPEDVRIGYLAGRLALQQRDVTEQKWALTLLTEASLKQATNANVLYDLARAQFSQGQLSEAEATLKRALARTPNFPAAQQLLEFASAANDGPRAAAMLPRAEELLKKEPDNMPALAVRARARALRGDAAGAIKDFEEIMARYPAFAPGVRTLAILYADLNNDKAAEYATKARDFYPNDPEILKVAGISAYRQRDYSKAITLLTEGAGKRPDDAPLQYYKGMAHFQLKQTKESQAALNKAIALKPDAPFVAEARRTLAQLPK